MRNYVLLIMTALLLLGCSARTSTSTVLDTTQLDTAFHEAEKVLYQLLMPNSMARTEPRTDAEVLGLLERFRELSRMFEENPSVSVPFLSAKVSTTPVDRQDPAICALQLLFEINNGAARCAILDAQMHPHEVVSRTATGMLRHGEDCLWGFRQLEQTKHKTMQSS